MIIFPCAVQYILYNLFILYTVICTLNPVYVFLILSPPSLLVSTSVFSVSVSLFLPMVYLFYIFFRFQNQLLSDILVTSNFCKLPFFYICWHFNVSQYDTFFLNDTKIILVITFQLFLHTFFRTSQIVQLLKSKAVSL